MKLIGNHGIDNRFKPGHDTWNKGLKGVNGSSPTRFTTGHKPHTWRPIGSQRIDQDGLLVEKITDVGSTHERWRPVHRTVWIAANGPVPAGHFVVFKPGMKSIVKDEITLDKLECIDRLESMRRNTVHRLPKELAQAIQLIGALNRQINKKENHE